MRAKFVPALLRGYAAHHAGCLPGWKGLVERCFQRGLVKLVFATGEEMKGDDAGMGGEGGGRVEERDLPLEWVERQMDRAGPHAIGAADHATLTTPSPMR